MKLRLLELLVCPACRGPNPLQLEEALWRNGEIEAGYLRCSGCAASHPVRNFIPRFVASDEYADSFGFEWNRFREVQIDVLRQTDESERTFAEKTGLAAGDLQGKLVLDAGAGAGRFSEVASRWGAADVIAVDLSSAVDACYQNIGKRPNVHIIQADLFKLPLRPMSLDIVYSIGVLHHTPDTKRAFQSVSRYPKPQGLLAVYIYPQSWGRYKGSDLLRKITTRLPKILLYYVSWLAVPLYYLYRVPLIGSALRLLIPISMHPQWRWRWLDTFDWYSPKYQWKHTYPEVFRWFADAGFTQIEPLETRDPICMRAVKRP